MVSRNVNYDAIHVNILQIFFHCPALGDKNYTAFYIRTNPWGCTVHNLHNHTCWHWATSVLSLLVPKWTLTWSTKSKDFIVNATHTLSHLSLAHLSSPVTMVNSPWIYTNSGITHGLSSSTWVLSSAQLELCRHDQDMRVKNAPAFVQIGKRFACSTLSQLSQRFPRRIKPYLLVALTRYFMYTL